MVQVTPARIAWHTGAALTLGLLWEAGARISGSLLIPSALETAAALGRLLGSADFWTAFWISNQALLIGFPIASAAGIVSGLALGRWPRVARWCEPHMRILLVVPKSALIPVVVMALGLGLASRSVVIGLFAFPIVAVTVQAGVRTVDRQLVAMARAFCAGEWLLWRRVLIPATRPAIMTALRLGLARAIAGMVAVELTFIAVGIGRQVLRFRADFDAASLYASVMVIIAEAVVLVRLAGLGERRLGAFDAGAVAE